MKKIINSLRGIYQFSVKSGYLRSIFASEPVDRMGDPLPWYTYPAIEYLDSLSFRNKCVFEYGSGNSTLWWSKRCKLVKSVEDDQAWFNLVKEKLSLAANKNVEFIFSKNIAEYIAALDTNFDVIVIDGKNRKNCVEHIISHELHSMANMIILDNADWHPNAVSKLRANLNWLEMDFSGFGPINPYSWTTSVFVNPEFAGDLKYARQLRSIAGIEQNDKND